MVGGANADAVAVVAFVVEAGVAKELVVLEGEEVVVVVSDAANEAIGETVACIGVGGVEVANQGVEGLVFGEGVVGEGEVGRGLVGCVVVEDGSCDGGGGADGVVCS